MGLQGPLTHIRSITINYFSDFDSINSHNRIKSTYDRCIIACLIVVAVILVTMTNTWSLIL